MAIDNRNRDMLFHANVFLKCGRAMFKYAKNLEVEGNQVVGFGKHKLLSAHI